MAQLKHSLIHAGKMASQDVRTFLANAVILDEDSNPIEAPNGALVDLIALRADTTYSATGREYDVYDAKAPAAEYKDLALVDYAGVQEGEIGGNVIRWGDKLYALRVPAEVATRVRRPAMHDKYWLGEANFDATPAIGDAYGIKAGEFVHGKIEAADEAAHQGYMVRVQIERELTTGMRNQGHIYMVEVIKL